jgi:hypothetical protein
MAKKNTTIQIHDAALTNKIYIIRNHKVMIDRDLALLYGVETKRLKEAVKRNISRFPIDFMFQMNAAEFKNWRTQFASSNSDKMGLRYAPFCFTEQGVAMLSSVLNSERAIAVNIQIMRLFTKLRKAITDTDELKREIEQIKKKLTTHGENIVMVFQYLDKLIEKKEKAEKQQARKKIGYLEKHD